MQAIRGEVAKVIVGQHNVVESLLITLLVGGHCLITGLPGTAKTLLVRTLSQALGLEFKRIQFTPDLMPTDITGTDIIEEDPATGHRSWTFVPGPVFANVLLADEINRTPPKTQSALLEAMQEGSVTVRGGRHLLPSPFFVLATQNPIELEGTYTLPEAQLDRFLFNVLLDYLTPEQEMDVLLRNTGGTPLEEVNACTDGEQIKQFQWLVRQIPIETGVARRIIEVVRATRPTDPTASDMVRKYLKYGASVRATQFLALGGKARALLHGRYHVAMEDVEALVKPVLRHRIITNYFAESDGITADAILERIIGSRG
ncbi:MAG: MoxR family ATPase [Gammaproteobacteria bacterium]|nr:MoxR family ATPase [Gammaproteobacteria bacterium]